MNFKDMLAAALGPLDEDLDDPHGHVDPANEDPYGFFESYEASHPCIHYPNKRLYVESCCKASQESPGNAYPMDAYDEEVLDHLDALMQAKFSCGVYMI